MTFDIIEITEEGLHDLTEVQTQLLRTAQKKKNAILHNMEADLEFFSLQLHSCGSYNSTLYEAKKQALQKEADYQIDILREQLLYSMELNNPYPDVGDEEAGYIVDYTLPYADRYAIVKEYYLSIADPVERINLYTADDVARRYLGSYYTVLYNVLYSYGA